MYHLPPDKSRWRQLLHWRAEQTSGLLLIKICNSRMMSQVKDEQLQGWDLSNEPLILISSTAQGGKWRPVLLMIHLIVQQMSHLHKLWLSLVKMKGLVRDYCRHRFRIKGNESPLSSGNRKLVYSDGCEYTSCWCKSQLPSPSWT